MKPTLKYTMIGLALAAGLVSLTADPDKSETSKSHKVSTPDPFKITPNVRVQLEYIEMPLLTMAALMDDKKATENDTILRARVAELVKNGKAKLLDIQMLTAPDGSKAVSESVREFIYPTEYEPSELPNEVHWYSKDGKEQTSIKNLITGPTPTAFETRNLGTTFEMQTSVDPDGPYIDVLFAPETVYFIDYSTYTEWNGPHGRADIVMPIMYTMRVTGALTVTDGKPALVTALSPKDDKGVTDLTRKVLVFIKADILHVK